MAVSFRRYIIIQGSEVHCPFPGQHVGSHMLDDHVTSMLARLARGWHLLFTSQVKRQRVNAWPHACSKTRTG
jgi:hypothetical protein